MDQTKKKILLVEDDTNLASVYKARLELEGFDVVLVVHVMLLLLWSAAERGCKNADSALMGKVP